MQYALRFTFHLLLINLMIALKSVWGQPEDAAIVEIHYSLNGEIINASPLLTDLQRKTTIQAGNPVSRYYIRKSIEAIYAIGHFSQVKAVMTPAQDGVLLRFRLTSKTRVGEIGFTETRLDKDLFLEVIKSRPGKEYSVEIAKEDQQRILDLYKDYGYFQAAVGLIPSSDSTPSSRVDLLYDISEGDRAHIQEIQFEGVKSIEEKRLEKDIRSKKGNVYQKQSVDDDTSRIRDIYRKNGYLTVKVEPRLNYDDESGAVSLLYKIIEGKKVNVEFVGDGIDRSAIEKKLILFKQDSYSDMILSSTAGQIRRIYQQKGYYDPEVNYQIERESNWEVVIRFDIELGEAPRIRRINFEGNQAFDNSVLLDQMETQPRSRLIIPGFGWLFSKGVFNPATYDTDRRALELFYKKAGYPEVQITTGKEIDKEDQLILYIKIDEGRRQLIDRVLIEGATIFETSQLYAKLAAKPGTSYSKDIVGHDQREFQSHYDREGYIYTSIEPHYQQETRTLTYRISEGAQARFGKFCFDGDGRIKLHVLRREFESLGLREGAVFNHDKLFVESRQRLLTSGLFRAIEIKALGRLVKDTEIIDVDVSAEVRKPGSISVSGGYISSEGIRGTVGITHNNLFKRNMRAGGKISRGTRGNLYEVTLIEPWLNLPLIERLIGHTIGTFRLFNDNLEEHEDIRARGGTANLAKRLGQFSNLAIQYKYQDLRDRADPPKIQTTVSSLGLEIHRDNRDHFLNPKNGWLNEGAIEYAGGFLKGETSFFKFTTDHRYYWQFWGDTVLTGAIRFGYERGLRGNRDEDIISFERFYAGGSTTVRGYEERGLGPEDEFGNNRGDVVFIFNTELRFPIYKFIGSVMFFDTGNVWNELSDIDDALPRSAVGLGVRLDTPLGPARFDVGAPLTGKFKPRFYLQLGQAF